MKKQVIIFTTHYVGAEIGTQYLFYNAQPIEHSEGKIYKLKQELIYASECLPETIANAGEQAKRIFIQGLIEKVLKNSASEKDEEVEVYVFAHAYDLGAKVVHELSVSNESFFLNMDWCTVFNPQKVKIFLTAFKHNPDVKAYKILQKPYFAGIQLELVKYAESLREWILELENSKPGLIAIKPIKSPSFDFDIQYWDQGFFTSKPPVTFINFLEKKNIPESLFLPSGENSGHKVKLRFIPYASLLQNKRIYAEIRKEFVKIDETSNEVSVHPTPIIFIGYFDLMSKKKPETGKPETEKPEIAPEPCFRFLDSSIWCRYVALEGDFVKNFETAVKTIEWAYHYNLYDTNVCKEYIEFHSRLVQESRLELGIGSGHSMSVYPFTFHSETKMLDNIKEKLKEINQTPLLKWNVLLFDDFADHCLRVGKEEKEPLKVEGKTKGEIVKNLIKKGTIINSDDGDDLLKTFHCVRNLSSAMKALQISSNPSEPKKSQQIIEKLPEGNQNEKNDAKKIIYDIVLLDYLFSYFDELEKGQDPYFGTELLDAIKGADQRDGLSIRQSYWIFPMTVFNEAIHSDLQERGFQSLEPHWHMIRGADPINTPLLFRSSLLDFMEEQARRILFEEKDLWQFLADSLSQKMESKEVKSKAISTYGRFIERFSADEGTPEGSAIGETANERLNGAHGLKDLRNHIRALLFLLGYSSGFDFPIIEHEFLLIEKAFKKYKTNPFNEPKKDHERLETKAQTALDNLAHIIYNISGKYF